MIDQPWASQTTPAPEPDKPPVAPAAAADAPPRGGIAEAIFADDTPVRMLAPGTGKTQTARLWAYARDERPWGGDAPPAAWYRFSGDRKGQHPRDHLAGFRGWMHADGYAGFEELYRSGAIREVACMAHIRRKFVDIQRAQGSAIAQEAIGRIARLYGVEQEARGSPPDRRVELRRRLSDILCSDAICQAMGKRSSNMMANWLLTACHSRTERFHSGDVALRAR
jgi:hypothetical protein